MKRRPVRLTALAPLVLLLPLAGCYYYAPVDSRPSNPEQTVRAEFPEPRDLELSSDVTVRSVVRIDGRPIDWRGDTLLLRAQRLHQTGDRSFRPPAGETFSLTRSELATLQDRRIDAGKSALLAGGVAVGATGLAALLFGGEAGGGGGDGSEPEGPTESRILGFVLPLPFFGGG